MARIKKIFNGTTFELTTPKSGNSLLNEKTRMIKQDSEQVTSPHILNGFNINNLIINHAYNDNNTINFNNNINLLNSTSQRLNISQQIATPSTLPAQLNNDSNLLIIDKQNPVLEKFLTKGNSVTTKFSAFIDREYIENNTSNQDFIKGEGQYQFLDSNLYEEISIDIELDTPVDTILQNTAFFQQNDPDRNVKEDYYFTAWPNSPYTFRKTTQTYSRLNTPFVIYNFKNACWEYRGIPNPYQYYSSVYSEPFSINDRRRELKILPTDPTSNDDFQDFYCFFDKYLLGNLPLTNSPINYLKSGLDFVNLNKQLSNLSLPSSQFGFPHYPKFHAFNDNILNMSKYLSKDIIIDRVSVNLDVDLQSEFDDDQDLEDISITSGINCSLNFFIVNQHKIKNSSDEYNYKTFKTLRSKNINSSLPIKPFKNVKNLKKDFYDYFPTFDKKEFYKTFNSIVDENLEIYKNVNRIFITKNLNYNDLIDFNNLSNVLIVNETPFLNNTSFENISSTPILDSVHHEIISFGNVDFYSKGKGNNVNIDYEIVKTKIKNNCDKFIDTDLIYQTYPQSTNNLSKHILDYSGNININSYIKKNSSILGLLTKTTSGLSSHILNYQIELNDSLNNFYQKPSQFIDQSLLLYSYDNNDSLTNDMLTKQTGRNVINGYSELTNNLSTQSIVTFPFDLDKNTTDSISLPIDKWAALKMNKSVNIELKKENNFSPYVLKPTDNIYFALSISPTLSPKIFKQLLKIKKGKVKFTLHGYTQKNNLKIYEKNECNLNQRNLSSVIIGNNDEITNEYLTDYSYNTIFNIYDRNYTGIFKNLSQLPFDISENVTTISDEIDFSTINDINNNPIDLKDVIFNEEGKWKNNVVIKNKTKNITQNNFLSLKYTVLCLNLKDYADDNAINLTAADLTDIQFAIKHESIGQYFKIKVINFNGSTQWILSNNIYDDTTVGYSLNELYTFKWNSIKNNFERIIDRKISNDETYLSQFLDNLSNPTHDILMDIGSKQLMGNTYIPYYCMNNNSDEFIYDDQETSKYIGQLLITLFNNQNINFDLGKAYSIAKEICFYKKQKREETLSLLNFIPSLSDKKYLNYYVNTKKYGQYNNIVQQRPYTTTVKNLTDKIDYVIEQKFINSDTGAEITNLNNVSVRNKSKYLNLIDAGYKSISNDGTIVRWDAIDFYNRVHVSFNDENVV